MIKWHINYKGIPALCKASKQACPLGIHYENEAEATQAIEEQYEKDFGLLPDETESKGMSVGEKKDFADLIKRISGIKSSGFDYECFASVSVAEEMGLDKIAIVDKNGLTVNLSMGEGGKKLDADVYVEKSIEGLSKYYKKFGIPIKDENLLARVIYYSADPEKSILVQSGGPNVLDAAIIKADGEIDIIEVKELERGAQLPLISLETDKNGAISESSLGEQSEYISKALEGIQIQDVDGTNVKLDFGSNKANQEFPLRHMIEEYRKKGATSFIYVSEDGNKINRIDLTGPTDEVVQTMVDKRIEASVNLRANLYKAKVNKDDIYRFNKILSKDYFISGRASDTESFTLKSIKADKITKAGDYVRVGGYVLPIKYDEYEENISKRIKKTDMKAFKLSLTGNIKTNY